MTIESEIIEEPIIEENQNDELLQSSHFFLGYSIKQDLTILNNDYSMRNNFTYGYIWIGEALTKSSMDRGGDENDGLAMKVNQLSRGQ